MNIKKFIKALFITVAIFAFMILFFWLLLYHGAVILLAFFTIGVIFLFLGILTYVYDRL